MRLQIILIGKISSGKTTFINAFIGRTILPCKTKETTNIILFIRHKKNVYQLYEAELIEDKDSGISIPKKISENPVKLGVEEIYRFLD